MTLAKKKFRQSISISIKLKVGVIAIAMFAANIPDASARTGGRIEPSVYCGITYRPGEANDIAEARQLLQADKAIKSGNSSLNN